MCDHEQGHGTNSLNVMAKDWTTTDMKIHGKIQPYFGHVLGQRMLNADY